MMQIPPSATASGLPWMPRHAEARLPLAMAQQHGISELLAGILAGRAIALDTVPQFLNPTLRDHLPDPFHLRDMDQAVARLLHAIEAGEPIAVFGDYDVDGATSTALLQRYFHALGISIRTYIPDRMAEGYGPTIPAITRLIDEGAKLLVTVDCGTLAHAPLAYAKSRGIDVIVLDHHLSSGDLPEACAIVNPNRVDETSPHRQLAAVGVTFLLLVALNRALRVAGHFKNRLEPPLLSMLDLVALGTVCDVMPLTALNRAFVTQGLKIMARRGNVGLSVLGDVARMDAWPNVYHCGFLLGPRINAGGRVGAAGLGVELLTCLDAAQAQDIAQRLDLHNAERQAIELMVCEQAMALAEQQSNMPVILVASEGWHQGVIGIVAGRLKEKFQRPAMVVALENGLGKASGRSVPGVDMGAAIHGAVALGLIEKGGGHAMAAGFSLEASQIPALHEYLIARMGAGVAAYQEARVMKYDGFISVAGATLATLDDIALGGPYGLGNPSPRFVIKSADIAHRQVMKEKHIRLAVSDHSSSARLNAIAFGATGTTLGERLMTHPRLHLMGELKRNQWQGQESAQLVIDDVALPD